MEASRCSVWWAPPLPYLLHGPHVDDAVPFGGHAENLVQHLLHVQLPALGVVEAVHDGGVLHL